MKSFCVGAFILSAVLILSACGGGGGGSTVMAPMAPTPQPRPDPQPAPLPTPAELRTMLRGIQQRADSIVVTDSVLFPASPEYQAARLQAVCDGTRCSVGGGMPFTAADAPIWLHPSDGPLYPRIARHPTGIITAVADTVDLSVHGWGGWLDHSYFTTEVREVRDPDRGGALAGLSFQAYSLGDATGTAPVSGSAVWQGMMVGAYHYDEGSAHVAGDARVTFDFASIDLDVALTNIRDANRSHPDMIWQNMPVRQGRFWAGADPNSLQGQFYGPNHEEVGGVFERNQIIGAFGATRQ